MAQMSKLAELRAKTDRELVCLVGNSLEIGLQCARAAADGPTRLRAKAEDICAKALILLPRIENLSERRRLEKKVTELQAVLERPIVARASGSV